VSAPAKDLRTFLRDVDEHPEQGVLRVTREVDSHHELSAVVKVLEPRGNPLVLFENVRGSEMPVAVSLCGTRERIAIALGEREEDCVEAFSRHLDAPVSARRVPGGPVKEVMHLGADVDLGALPVPVHTAVDGGRYLTAAIGVVRDPDTGHVNTGIYRMMIKGRNRLTVWPARPHDLAKLVDRARVRGEAVEFAIVVGHHPTLAIGSQGKNEMTTDAFELTSALMGQPLEVTPAETIDIDIPAHAEIVIEGRILPDVMEEEGPFGEFTYYSGSTVAPVCEVSAITHRHDAIFVDLHPTHPEHRCLWIFPAREARLLTKLREILPGTRKVHIPLHGAGMSAYVALDPTHDSDGRRALMAVLTADSYIKHAIVVDSDVDIFDDHDVLWALNVRFQGDADMIVLPNSRGIPLDPTSYSLTARLDRGGMTTKVGFDATTPVSVPFPKRVDGLPEAHADLRLDDYLPAASLPAALKR
jgi:2,5-furandicarboxylate decarboxylase 1